MHRLPALLVATLVAAVVTAATSIPVSADSPSAYRPPADAEIIDPFRPPSTTYGPGNRGIDLDTARGDPVWAANGGEVVFAGPVGGSLHVVVAHDDGLRTSYSFLDRVTVRPGDHVEGGTRVGTAGGTTHFGVRAGDAYLDPEALFGEPMRVHLVPSGSRTAAEEAARDRLMDQLWLRGGAGGGFSPLPAIGAAVAWARHTSGDAVDGLQHVLDLAAEGVVMEILALHQELLTYGHYLYELNPLVHMARVAVAVRRWVDHLDECTPAGTRPPTAPRQRRIVVLVGGLNSSTANAAVDDVDTVALGYADGDVIRFSYNGGRIPDPDDSLQGITANGYEAVDTTRDLNVSADLLVELLREIRLEAPGVPVDVIAHSQGGVVARMAMGRIESLDARNPDVGTLVTLGSPHHGADLATAASQVGRSAPGALALGLADEATGLGLGPTSVSPGQLSETSPLMRDLSDDPMPDHVEVVSIAARGDLVVPAGRSHLDGATNTIVGLGGVTAHDRLPGSDEAQREMQLALAGLPPTCEGFAPFVADHLVSDLIALGEDAIGFGAALGARRLGATMPQPRWPTRRTSVPVTVAP